MPVAMPEYARAAETLLLGCRGEAAKAADPTNPGRFDDLFAAIERSARGRLGARLGLDRDEADVVLGGVVGSYVVQARIAGDGDEDLAEALGGILPALWYGDMSKRLTGARDLQPFVAGGAPHGLDSVALLLRKSGSELVAASGHLVRRVVRDGYDGFATGWYGALGDRLLSARAATRAAAVAQVRSGAAKTTVADLAGISRTTLDNWLTAETRRDPAGHSQKVPGDLSKPTGTAGD